MNNAEYFVLTVKLHVNSYSTGELSLKLSPQDIFGIYITNIKSFVKQNTFKIFMKLQNRNEVKYLFCKAFSTVFRCNRWRISEYYRNMRKVLVVYSSHNFEPYSDHELKKKTKTTKAVSLLYFVFSGFRQSGTYRLNIPLPWAWGCVDGGWGIGLAVWGSGIPARVAAGKENNICCHLQTQTRRRSASSSAPK